MDARRSRTPNAAIGQQQRAASSNRPQSSQSRNGRGGFHSTNSTVEMDTTGRHSSQGRKAAINSNPDIGSNAITLRRGREQEARRSAKKAALAAVDESCDAVDTRFLRIMDEMVSTFETAAQVGTSDKKKPPTNNSDSSAQEKHATLSTATPTTGGDGGGSGAIEHLERWVRPRLSEVSEVPETVEGSRRSLTVSSDDTDNMMMAAIPQALRISGGSLGRPMLSPSSSTTQHPNYAAAGKPVRALRGRYSGGGRMLQMMGSFSLPSSAQPSPSNQQQSTSPSVAQQQQPQSATPSNEWSPSHFSPSNAHGGPRRRRETSSYATAMSPTELSNGLGEKPLFKDCPLSVDVGGIQMPYDDYVQLMKEFGVDPTDNASVALHISRQFSTTGTIDSYSPKHNSTLWGSTPVGAASVRRSKAGGSPTLSAEEEKEKDNKKRSNSPPAVVAATGALIGSGASVFSAVVAQIKGDAKRTYQQLVKALQGKIDFSMVPAARVEEIVNESIQGLSQQAAATATRPQDRMDNVDIHWFSSANAIREVVSGTTGDRFALADRALSRLDMGEKMAMDARRGQLRRGLSTIGFQFMDGSPIAITFEPIQDHTDAASISAYERTSRLSGIRSKCVLIGWVSWPPGEDVARQQAKRDEMPPNAGTVNGEVAFAQKRRKELREHRDETKPVLKRWQRMMMYGSQDELPEAIRLKKREELIEAAKNRLMQLNQTIEIEVSAVGRQSSGTVDISRESLGSHAGISPTASIATRSPQGFTVRSPSQSIQGRSPGLASSIPEPISPTAASTVSGASPFPLASPSEPVPLQPPMGSMITGTGPGSSLSSYPARTTSEAVISISGANSSITGANTSNPDPLADAEIAAAAAAELADEMSRDALSFDEAAMEGRMPEHLQTTLKAKFDECRKPMRNHPQFYGKHFEEFVPYRELVFRPAHLVTYEVANVDPSESGGGRGRIRTERSNSRKKTQERFTPLECTTRWSSVISEIEKQFAGDCWVRQWTSFPDAARHGSQIELQNLLGLCRRGSVSIDVHDARTEALQYRHSFTFTDIVAGKNLPSSLKKPKPA